MGVICPVVESSLAATGGRHWILVAIAPEAKSVEGACRHAGSRPAATFQTADTKVESRPARGYPGGSRDRAAFLACVYTRGNASTCRYSHAHLFFFAPSRPLDTVLLALAYPRTSPTIVACGILAAPSSSSHILTAFFCALSRRLDTVLLVPACSRASRAAGCAVTSSLDVVSVFAYGQDLGLAFQSLAAASIGPAVGWAHSVPDAIAVQHAAALILGTSVLNRAAWVSPSDWTPRRPLQHYCHLLSTPGYLTPRFWTPSYQNCSLSNQLPFLHSHLYPCPLSPHRVRTPQSVSKWPAHPILLLLDRSVQEPFRILCESTLTRTLSILSPPSVTTVQLLATAATGMAAPFLATFVLHLMSIPPPRRTLQTVSNLENFSLLLISLPIFEAESSFHPSEVFLNLEGVVAPSTTSPIPITAQSTMESRHPMLP
ncbi:hypothetical protein DFH06DRAFT_1386425 [Mycena polygramma]|nr:hypothetical protein DFH06DRAFT_1386425 [Mycena polygramma]